MFFCLFFQDMLRGFKKVKQLQKAQNPGFILVIPGEKATFVFLQYDIYDLLVPFLLINLLIMMKTIIN